jgi:hypothetical protein
MRSSRTFPGPFVVATRCDRVGGTFFLPWIRGGLQLLPLGGGFLPWNVGGRWILELSLVDRSGGRRWLVCRFPLVDVEVDEKTSDRFTVG